jgi:hypothetical protein
MALRIARVEKFIGHRQNIHLGVGFDFLDASSNVSATSKKSALGHW